MDIIIPYLFIYTFVTVGAIAASIFRRAQKHIFYVCAIAVFLFIGLRNYTVGTDTAHYMDFFLHPEMGFGGGETDFGFDIVVNILHVFINTYPPFNLVVTAIYLFGLFFLIRKDCKYPMIGLFIFVIIGTAESFFHQYMNIIRQCMALSFYFIALHYFNRFIIENRENNHTSADVIGNPETDGRPLPPSAATPETADKTKTTHAESSEHTPTNELFMAGLFYIIAASIHATVLISFPVLFLCWRGFNFNKTVWLLLITGSYFLGVQNYFSVADIFFRLFSLIGPGFHFIDKYANYGMVNFGDVTVTSLFNWMLIPFTALACLIILLCNEEERKSLFIKMFCTGVILNNILNDNLMWARLLMYFTMLVIIVLPNVMCRLKWWVRIPFFIALTGYFAYKIFNQFMYMWITPSGNVIIPYETFINT